MPAEDPQLTQINLELEQAKAEMQVHNLKAREECKEVLQMLKDESTP